MWAAEGPLFKNRQMLGQVITYQVFRHPVPYKNTQIYNTDLYTDR